MFDVCRGLLRAVDMPCMSSTILDLGGKSLSWSTSGLASSSLQSPDHKATPVANRSSCLTGLGPHDSSSRGWSNTHYRPQLSIILTSRRRNGDPRESRCTVRASCWEEQGRLCPEKKPAVIRSWKRLCLYEKKFLPWGAGRRGVEQSRGRSGDCKPRALSSDLHGESSEPESSQETSFVKAESTEAEVPFFRKISLFQDAFWRFLRPHTIRGTVLGSTALVAKALIENPHLINWILLPKALRGLLALLCGNGYIVGVNQIYDVGIDKINKPFLPIAAGDLSVPVAWALVLGLAALGIGLVAANFGPLITGLYFLGLFLGTIYSVPPFHLKRFPVPAFLIIATVRGFLLNFGVYYATRAALGLPFQWSPSIIFITCFVTVFATVIAITKDLTDVEGDRKFNISTFATRLGVRNISFLGASLLLANYIGAIGVAIYFPKAFNRKVMIPADFILAAALVQQTWVLDSAKYTKESIAGFYRFIWNLFYAQYTLLPFI